jgi:hypothetical protein
MASVGAARPGVAGSERRARELLCRLSALLPGAVQSAERAQDFFALFKSLLAQGPADAAAPVGAAAADGRGERAVFLAAKGFVWRLIDLIAEQVGELDDVYVRACV